MKLDERLRLGGACLIPAYTSLHMATTEDPRRLDATEEWRRELYDAKSERDALFTTISGLPIEPLYSPDSVEIDYERDLGYPGLYPFTRGVYPSMYRGKLWTMRQFAGFGTAEETNARFRYLLEHGQTGLSTAFDMPTLMGYDSDHPKSLGEVGREGVAIDSLEDMEQLFAGIPLDEVSTSMTINAPAAMLLAFYICVGEEQGVPRDRLRGTIQTDILKEYIAQKEWIFPPEPSMRLCVDMIEFCAKEVPRWHPVSISGYHIREAGSTAAQELAFTLADGFAYVEAAMARGLDVDDFAPRLSFFFNAHIDFFEEIAKYRAARRIWARELRERYGARNPRSWLMRFHTQTAGVSLTAQQPEVNIVRTAIEALAAVLGGTQSLHTNSFDEALALPTEQAAKLALRTQQVIAHETGVTDTIDPLGGSYFVEGLTNRLEAEAYDYFGRIRELGGVVAAIRDNFFQREIAEASFRFQNEVEAGQRVIVGVNRFQEEDSRPIEILRIDQALEDKQVERIRSLKGRRDSAAVEQALAQLRTDAAVPDRNLMPAIVDASRVYVTMGEMCDALREVWGTWRETPVF
jgi:methylmalonyl-CoA mutase N-terminal domain/subunit